MQNKFSPGWSGSASERLSAFASLNLSRSTTVEYEKSAILSQVFVRRFGRAKIPLFACIGVKNWAFGQILAV